MPNMLIKLVAGAVGGVIGTLLMQKTMPLAKKLPESIKPPMPAKDPGHFMVSQVERLVGALSPKVHSGTAQGLHWGYGVSWPLGLAALSGVLGLRSVGKTIAAGAALGAVCWAAGYAGWLPATGLTPWPHRVPLGKNASSLVSHVAYGAVASLPLALATSRAQA